MMKIGMTKTMRAYRWAKVFGVQTKEALPWLSAAVRHEVKSPSSLVTLTQFQAETVVSLLHNQEDKEEAQKANARLGRMRSWEEMDVVSQR